MLDTVISYLPLVFLLVFTAPLQVDAIIILFLEGETEAQRSYDMDPTSHR